MFMFGNERGDFVAEFNLPLVGDGGDTLDRVECDAYVFDPLGWGTVFSFFTDMPSFVRKAITACMRNKH